MEVLNGDNNLSATRLRPAVVDQPRMSNNSNNIRKYVYRKKKPSIHCLNPKHFRPHSAHKFPRSQSIEPNWWVNRAPRHWEDQRMRHMWYKDQIFFIKWRSREYGEPEHQREINLIAERYHRSVSCLLTKFSCIRRKKWPSVRHAASAADYVHLNWTFWTTATTKLSTCVGRQVAADAVSHVVCKLWMSVHRQAPE